MKALASSGACGEIITTVSAPAAIIRSVSSAIPAIELRTSAIASRPTSGTMVGGWGAIPAKTNELVWAMRLTPETTEETQRSFGRRDFSTVIEQGLAISMA